MAGAEDFIEGDPFDPAFQEKVEIAETQGVQNADAQVREYLSKRKNAYTALFDGVGTVGDANFVMRDLAVFCRAYAPTWNLNQKVQDLQEGRREVYQRIMRFSCLSHETLYLQYIADMQVRK